MVELPSKECSVKTVDDANREFWNDLCGSTLACQVGITDYSPTSLKCFDDAYLNLYPYLLNEVPVSSFSGKHVLEVGLGYGTLGQKIVEAGALYQGLDISDGPVDMMNRRLQLMSRPKTAKRGSMLECPFADGTFDAVVSVGCFHHTGDLEQCVKETYRVLKPAGYAYIMVYNKYSYRNWLRWPLATLTTMFATQYQGATREQRAAYDTDSQGNAAPETIFVSIEELRKMFHRFSEFAASKRNWGGFTPFGVPVIPRKLLLELIGPVCGLDIYVKAKK